MPGWLALKFIVMASSKKREGPSKHGIKIPRSLQIKCELTTLPSYANNQYFPRLKEELQEKVALFIQKGTKVMSELASTNLQPLMHNRCSNIIEKARQILDDLTSFTQKF